MHIKTIADGEKFWCAGHEYLMLLPRDLTDCCEAAMETLVVGESTPPNAHTTFHQVHVILQGEAEITIGEEKRRVSAPAISFIPKGTNHWVQNVGAAELRYIYITIWSDGIPAGEKDGGWRKACTDMVKEYADRGYPPERSSK
jgi:mannose-6-phosphate isomerase-like protein (cupin superfamily)